MGGYWGGISPAMRDKLDSALADVKRGHRLHEWEGVAGRLFDAIEAIETAEPTLDDDADPVEQMAFWAQRVLENDGALSADSSNSLDDAHDQLTEAARAYLSGGEAKNTRAAALGSMQAEVIAWAITKGWHGPDAPEVRFGEAMALLHSEVSEALEAFRTHGVEDFTGSVDSTLPASLVEEVGAERAREIIREREGGRLPKPEGVGSEFADILIRLLHYSEIFGVDLAAEYERKMAYNHTRTFRHGGRAL